MGWQEDYDQIVRETRNPDGHRINRDMMAQAQKWKTDPGRALGAQQARETNQRKHIPITLPTPPWSKG